jgi:hypothetical protein
VTAATNLGKSVGIYSTTANWQYAFKSTTACGNFGQYPLWFQNNDGVKSLTGFTPFGGWNNPSMKRYLVSYQYCGTSINFDYSL